jgi:hypothetical protein
MEGGCWQIPQFVEEIKHSASKVHMQCSFVRVLRVGWRKGNELRSELNPWLFGRRSKVSIVRFEVITAVTMKNDVFWDVTPCGSCMNRHFGET